MHYCKNQHLFPKQARQTGFCENRSGLPALFFAGKGRLRAQGLRSDLGIAPYGAGVKKFFNPETDLPG